MVGNKYTSQRKITSPAERYVQKAGGTMRNTVDALRSPVKTIIETTSEVIMIMGAFLPFSPMEPARIIGSTGSTHGANALRIPARMTMNARNIYA